MFYIYVQAANGGLNNLNFYNIVYDLQKNDSQIVKQIMVKDYLKLFDDWKNKLNKNLF